MAPGIIPQSARKTFTAVQPDLHLLKGREAWPFPNYRLSALIEHLERSWERGKKDHPGVLAVFFGKYRRP